MGGRRSDHQQGARRSRRHGHPRRIRSEDRSAAFAAAVQGRRTGHQPLAVLRELQYVETGIATGTERARRSRAGAETGGLGRRRGRELHARHDGALRSRLSDAVGKPRRPRDGEHVHARANGTGASLHRLRQPGRSARRTRRDNRLARSRSCRTLGRVHRFHHAALRHRGADGRTAASRRDRPRSVHRSVADRSRHSVSRAARSRPRSQRPHRERGRQRVELRVPARHVQDARAGAIPRHRRRHRGTVAVSMRTRAILRTVAAR